MGLLIVLMGGKLGLWFWMKGIYLDGVENRMLKEINRCKREEAVKERIKLYSEEHNHL
jgi:hypothetical protein